MYLTSQLRERERRRRERETRGRERLEALTVQPCIIGREHGISDVNGVYGVVLPLDIFGGGVGPNGSEADKCGSVKEVPEVPTPTFRNISRSKIGVMRVTSRVLVRSLQSTISFQEVKVEVDVRTY
eukprot:169504-Hanusia_phi.AAC.1